MTTKSFHGVQIKDAVKGEVEAVFSTFDVIDSDGDVTSKSTFTDGAPVVISAYGHGSWKGALPVGRGSIHVEDSQAVMKGRFFMDTTHGRDTFLTVKALSEDEGLQEWSYSLHDVVAEKGELEGEPANFLRSVKVKETSPVLLGASVGTHTRSTKDDDAGDPGDADAPKGTRFSEQVTTVLADVDQLIERATEVVALRASKGKGLADESAAALGRLDGQLAALKQLLATPQDNSDAQREYARYVAITQGVTTP